jgi:hypothetical protein
VQEALKKVKTHEFVMCRWMMFGKIIGTIQFAGGPIEIELLLSNSIFEPMIPHIESLGFFEANLGMKNAVSS